MAIGKDIEDFQSLIGYQFSDTQRLKQALTHSSYANEHRMSKFQNNERLEFLGDAVLEIVTSDFLYRKYDDMLEGELTKFRASIVCEPTLANFSKEIKLGDYLLLGKGEDNSGGRFRASVLSDAVEALIGAIYLDGGIDEARIFIEATLLQNVEQRKLFVDSKTHLQELIQKSSDNAITYEVVAERGPDHSKLFEVTANHNSKIIGHGFGRSKKSAEQEAAFDAIKEIGEFGLND